MFETLHEAVLRSLGMDMSGAIKVFLRQVVMQGGLPFEVRLQPNARTLRGIGMTSFELRDYVERVRAETGIALDIITPGEDDLFAFGVVAPEGMSNEEFRELIQRAWYW